MQLKHRNQRFKSHEILHINKMFKSHFNPHRPTSRIFLHSWFHFTPFAWFRRYYFSLLRRIQNSGLCHTHSLSLLVPIWSELTAHGSRYIAAERTTQKSQFYCCIRETTEKTSHVIVTSPVHWRADCCLATSYKNSSYVVTHSTKDCLQVVA
jgi:hypothetical protein